MKKIIAVLAAAFMFGTFAFAEGYICANDLEKGQITSEKSEEDGFVVEPDWVELVFDGVGETNGLTIARSGDKVDFSVAFVTFDAVVGVSVDDLRAVGANIVFAHFAKLPHDFGGETAVLDGDVGFADDGFIDQLTAIATHGEQECC